VAGVTTGLNRDCIGRQYVAEAVAEPAHMTAFAEAVNDPNPRYVDASREGGIVAHPSFVVRLLCSLSPLLLADDDLNLDYTRLVHGEQMYHWHHPIRPGDVVRLEATLSEIVDKHSGQVLRQKQRLFVGDRLVVSGESAAFIRGVGPLPPRPPRPSEPPPPFRPAAVELLHSETCDVAADQAIRYAEASTDHNPIHLDREAATSAGLPGLILHGTCTLAFAVRAIVNGVLGGDPSRLERLSVRFSNLVNIPDVVTTEVWANPDNGLRFEVFNGQGKRVLSRGTAAAGR
jgi:acyl dehydratase